MTLRTLLAAALLLGLSSTAALAGGEKGYVQFPGIGPNAGSSTRHGWLDMPGSDLTVEMDPGTQCLVTVDAIANSFAPALVGMVGDTVDLVTIELKDFHSQTTYRAKLENAVVRKVLSSTDEGVHIEQVTLDPAHVVFEVWKPMPNGQIGAPATREISCGASRT
jgi:hypothetical protein